jgi:hypothetical protein
VLTLCGSHNPTPSTFSSLTPPLSHGHGGWSHGRLLLQLPPRLIPPVLLSSVPSLSASDGPPSLTSLPAQSLTTTSVAGMLSSPRCRLPFSPLWPPPPRLPAAALRRPYPHRRAAAMVRPSCPSRAAMARPSRPTPAAAVRHSPFVSLAGSRGLAFSPRVGDRGRPLQPGRLHAASPARGHGWTKLPATSTPAAHPVSSAPHLRAMEPGEESTHPTSGLQIVASLPTLGSTCCCQWLLLTRTRPAATASPPVRSPNLARALAGGELPCTHPPEALLLHRPVSSCRQVDLDGRRRTYAVVLERAMVVLTWVGPAYHRVPC